MLFAQEGKQLWRTPIRTLALCLALALATGMLSIAFGLKQASEQMQGQVESEYTTVGYVPTTPALYLTSSERMQKSFLSSKNELFRALNREDFIPQIALHIDQHSRLMAYDSALIGAISDIYDLNRPHNVAVFAVKCSEILVSSTATVRQSKVVDGKTVTTLASTNSYYYHFEVEQVISLHEDFEPPSRLTMTTRVYNIEPTTSALEIGGTYLIWGLYEDLGEGIGKLTTTRDQLWEEEVMKNQWVSDGFFYTYFPSQYYPTYKLPFLAKYSGSPEEYIARDTTGMWDRLLHIVEISHSSLQIYSADHPNALRAFIDKNAELKEGTFFSEADLESGAKVAMISEVLAEKNGIEVGDTLDLSFYQSSYSDWILSGWTYFAGESMLMPKQLFGGSEADDLTYIQKFNLNSQPASIENDTYTVVGIYSVDGWVNNIDYIHPNTVIIPQASLSRVYSLDIPQLDRTFILPNGSVDAFEEELAEAGFGGILHYYDQGYSSIIPGVEAICHSAEFVCRISLVLWILAVLMILLIFTWMQMPTGKVKYRLGTGKMRIWSQMSFSALLVMFLSCVGGYAGSILLYDRAIEWMMQADFTSFNTNFSTQSVNADMLTDLLDMMEQSPDLFAKVCAAQFVVLLLCAVIFAAVASLRKKSFKQ